MEVLVFRTNLKYLKDIKKVKGVMTEEKRISKWNVDRTDIDSVLRVEAENIIPEEVIHLVKTAGFACEEL